LEDDLFIARTPVDEVYNFIFSELNAATTDLPNKSEAKIGGLSKQAATGLNARAVLFNERYSDAATLSSSLITGSLNDGLELFRPNPASQEEAATNYKELFLSEGGNVETLYEITFLPPERSHQFDRENWPVQWRNDNGGQTDPTQELIDAFQMENGLAVDDGGSGCDVAAPYNRNRTGTPLCFRRQTSGPASNFELQLEFKLTEGANSGIKYFVDPSLNKGSGSAIGLEFQILDDKNHPDAKMGIKGNRTAGSLYDLITAEVLETPRHKEIWINDWNRGRIVVKGGHVEHWLNGYKVVEYDRFSQIFQALVAYSKYRDWESFGQWPAGPILLQDHGGAVSFRSIKVREF
jgi:hypothetical protein